MSHISKRTVAVTKPAPRSAKADTISRLIQAARAEFAGKGLAGARVDVIARNAGVTKQLVYHYYHSKEELFSAVLDDASCSTMPKLVSQQFDHLAPREALRCFLYEIFEQYRSDPLLGPLAREGGRFHEEHPSPRNRFIDLTPTLRTSFQGILARGIEAGEFCDRADGRWLLAMASLVMTGNFVHRHSLSVLLEEDPASDDGMARWREAAVDFVLAALRPEAG